MPAFFLSDAIAIPEIFRSFIWEKFFCLMPPKAIKLVEKPRESKLNFILPKKPFLYLYFVLNTLDKKIWLHPWFIFSLISEGLWALPIMSIL